MNIDDLLKRFSKATNRYEMFRSLHQDAFTYACPNREGWKQVSDGQPRTKVIYDATAANGLSTAANRIIQALMPAWTKWIEFTPGSEIPEGEKKEMEEALKNLTAKFFEILNQSNFYTELAPSIKDCLIGTGAILVEEEEFGKPGILRFTSIPLHELYLEPCIGGGPDNVWRKFKMHPAYIKRTWPDAKLSKMLEDMAEKPDSDEVQLLNAMLYEDGNYKQYVIHEESKTVIFEQTFTSKRLIAFRWEVTSGEVYGRGPIINVLPDIKTANVVKEMMLQNAALQVAGVYTGVDDGIFNPHTARIAPGVILPVGSNASANPSLMPLARSGDIGLGDLVLKDLQASINKALFVNQLGEITDPTKSATEMMIRQQEMLKDAGANFGRLKSELINELVSAITDIMRGRGLWPDFKVDGKIIGIAHQSPIAKAEKMEDYQNFQVWWSGIAQSGLPPEMINIAVALEKLPDIAREMLGVTPQVVRTEEEQAAMRQNMAAQQQAMAQGGAVGQ